MKCTRCNRRKSAGIIRKKDVCNSCYEIINKDNYFRIKAGKPIPKDFAMIIELDRNGKIVSF